MNRRHFLASLVGVPLLVKSALGISAVEPSIEVMSAGAWTTVPVKGWRIAFPDGTIFDFEGSVIHSAIHAPVDGLMTESIRVQPHGPFKLSQGEKTLATTLSRNGERIGEVREVNLPNIDRELIEADAIDGYQTYVVGPLKRIGPMSFEVIFDSDNIRSPYWGDDAL